MVRCCCIAFALLHLRPFRTGCFLCLAPSFLSKATRAKAHGGLATEHMNTQCGQWWRKVAGEHRVHPVDFGGCSFSPEVSHVVDEGGSSRSKVKGWAGLGLAFRGG